MKLSTTLAVFSLAAAVSAIPLSLEARASSTKGNVGCDTSDDEALPCKKPSGTSDAVFAMATSRTSLNFVTQTCKVDSDCRQSCCAFNTGKCAGPGIAQTRDGGCGHGNAKPNCNVATALDLETCAKGAQNGDVTSSEVQSAAAFVSIIDKLPFTPKSGGSTKTTKKTKTTKTTKASKSSKTSTPPKSNNASNSGGSSGNVGCDTNDDEALPCKKPSGTSDAVFALATSRTALKFVTETCSVDTDCKQSCCGFNTGKCAGPAFAQESFGGCGHGNAKPNCNVAAALKLDDCVKGAQNGDLSSSEVQSASAFVSIIDKLKFTPTS